MGAVLIIHPIETHAHTPSETFLAFYGRFREGAERLGVGRVDEPESSSGGGGIESDRTSGHPTFGDSTIRIRLISSMFGSAPCRQTELAGSRLDRGSMRGQTPPDSDEP